MPVRLCFVCLGNICRSPTAEGIFAALVADAGLDEQILVDSAGTGAWHVGEPADLRSRQTARRRGVTLTSRARQFEARDFARFDYVLALDRENRRELAHLAPDSGAQRKIHLLRRFDAESDGPDDVPDPYYGGHDGFDRVFDICHAACRGLLVFLIAEHGLAA